MNRMMRRSAAWLMAWAGAGSAYAQQPLDFRPVSPGVSLGAPSVSLGSPVVRSSMPEPASPGLEFRDVLPAEAVVRFKTQDSGHSINVLQVEPVRPMMPVLPPQQVMPVLPPPKGAFNPPEPKMMPQAPVYGYPPTMHSPDAIVTSEPYHESTSVGNGCCGATVVSQGGLFSRLFGDDSCDACDPCGSSCLSFLGCNDACNDCCPTRPKAWIRAEYLLWSLRKQSAPPLFFQNSVDPNFLINSPNSEVLFGNDQIANSASSGARISAGFWFPNNTCWGLDASYFFLGKRTSSFYNFTAGASGIGTGRPFIDEDGVPQTEYIAVPPGRVPGIPLGGDGSFLATYSTQLWGFDANLRRKLMCGPRGHLDLLLGYRHLQLNDTFNMQEDITQFNTPGIGNTRQFLSDRFSTNNTFHGGQIGIDGERKIGRRAFLAGSFKFAMGNMSQTVRIAGNSFRVEPNGLRTDFRGALYTSPTNIGTYTANRFCVMPELGLRIGIDLTDNLRMFAGYNLLYVSEVVRAGEQIDQVVNLSRSPIFGIPATGAFRPGVLFRTNDFVAHGLNAGLEYKW